MRRWAAAALVVATGAWGGPEIEEIGPGVSFIRGQFTRGVQPDGNSLVLHSPEGTVVIDTGRHREHTHRVMRVATRDGKLPVAVINTHWHLDHVGGNPKFRDRYPKATIYASDAINAARKGFLAEYRQQLADAIAATTPEKSVAFRGELELIDTGDKLGPDEVITKTGERTLGGRRLLIGLEKNAATEGDVWVLDRASGILATGDLVTLPVPFLDTASPEGWAAALDRLVKVDAKLIVPGHGEPMSPMGLFTYRRAFRELLACAKSSRPSADCSTEWFATIGDLSRGTDPALARSALGYYLDNMLRKKEAAGGK